MKPLMRHLARYHALQGLYGSGMTGNSAAVIEGNMLDNEAMQKILHKVDIPFFQVLLQGVLRNLSDLDLLLKPHLDREPNEVDLIELYLLRMSAFELTHCDTPYRVVINEAIELAKQFGGEGGHKYVNGVLDKLVPALSTHPKAQS